MNKQRIGAALLVVGTVVLGLSALAAADTNINEGVCQPQTAHIQGGDFKTVTVTAPEGKLITGYCVKAGSVNQDPPLGPEYVTVNPPAKTVTISHSSGKDISHYIVFYGDDPGVTTTASPTTTVVVTTTAASTTVPEPTTSIPSCEEGYPPDACPLPTTTVYVNQPPSTPTWVPGEEPPGCGSACPEPDLPPETTMSPAPVPVSVPATLPSTGFGDHVPLLVTALGLIVAGTALQRPWKRRSDVASGE